ncbi:type III secretion system chaperone [uncultured Mailhella sp.]|uniref:type III secretion system chaperone n=1 Tax=uncultured Mailhella sp. TaxID=1981031 RepID=UPI0025DC856D|nr:type III secretion system chaperone [uncultured Mailhella sp.]
MAQKDAKCQRGPGIAPGASAVRRTRRGIVREDDPSCLLVIDDVEVSLRWLEEADMVMMFTVAVPLPREEREVFYAELLNANTFFTARRALRWPRGKTRE